MKKKLWGICSEAAPVKGTAAHVPVCWVCSLLHVLQHLVVGSGDDNVLYWPPALIVAGYYWFNIHMPVVVYWVSRGKKEKGKKKNRLGSSISCMRLPWFG